MPQLSAISKQCPADKSWTRYSSYDFASKECIAPLVGAEMAKAVLCMPIAFVKQQDSFLLVAVLSLTPGTNRFVARDGQWLGGYVPSVFRGYPFQLAKTEGQDNLVLCVDEDSGLINEDKAAGEPFFDDNGEISQPVKDILNFLTRLSQNKAVTNSAVSALAVAGVITEWSLKIKDGDQEKSVTGLYRIDEAKLNNLEDDSFLKIRKAGALPIVYAQLLSMNNIKIFTQLAKAQAQKKTPDSDNNFVFGDDDIISFQ